jgi:hypothetical protein
MCNDLNKIVTESLEGTELVGLAAHECNVMCSVCCIHVQHA